MIKRTCPACGAIRYSANDSGDWTCDCGAKLTAELNEVELNEGKWNEAGRAILQFQNEAFNNFVISALREKAEREKGCEYCTKEDQRNSSGRIFYKEFPHDTDTLTSLDDSHLELAFDKNSGWVLHFEDDYGDRMFDVKITRCPHCGRELPKEEK